MDLYSYSLRNIHVSYLTSVYFPTDDLGSRPHSEVKAWTPSEAPPPVAQSAPPSLVDIERGHELS